MQQGPRDQPILAPSDWQGDPQHLISQLYQSVWTLVCHTEQGSAFLTPFSRSRLAQALDRA